MRKLALVFVLLLLTLPAFSQTDTEAPALLKAHMTLDKKQTGEKADREIEVMAIPADGFIQGTDGTEKKYILFSDIEEITWDLGTHSHTVKTWDGQTHVLKWGLIKSENTATAVTFKVKDPKSGELVDESVGPAEIKRLAFIKPEEKEKK